ncbi:hypothetical protein [Synergistes jonesii]|uniref:Phage tail protein n=1 Tax=Synergistes jonesii TaxID=2754 RepID=A0A073IUE3_9BACT|nr:hypothetical protein [Synergistes jonesii]KEJ93210.1 hypothetical protein EH55_12980 [Synergistes jonesii]OFB60687.1 hypothetical protein JS72_11925 [Synergistes jonesii]OFB64816.1 hypothetical protein JS73_02960 [Synergistes jonesii]OFB66117.1 hypothetical protein JS79_02965 [Synergistes jonesii]OFB68976.1 hypothetical protein JS78_02965 [Synergistes jonesii]
MSDRLTKNAQILISATAEGIPKELDVLTKFTFDESKKEIQTTKLNSKNHTYETGIADAKGSFEMTTDPDSESGEILEAAHANDSVVYLIIRPEGTGASKEQIKIPAKVSSHSTDYALDDMIKVSCNFVAVGAVDRTAQPAG